MRLACLKGAKSGKARAECKCLFPRKRTPNQDNSDFDIFNQLVRMIPLPNEDPSMRGVDRVSGSFLVVLIAGMVLLCGGLLAAALG